MRLLLIALLAVFGISSQVLAEEFSLTIRITASDLPNFKFRPVRPSP